MAVRCLACGAQNRDGADWCNQCYTSLTKPAEPLRSDPPPEDGPQRLPGIGTPLPDPEPTPPTPVTAGSPEWECPVCEGRNPISEGTCGLCGTPMTEAFTPPEDDHDIAAVRPWAIIPGGGHAKAGAGITGMAVFFLVAMALGFGIPLLTGEKTSVVGLLIVLVGGGVWAASAFDVLRKVETGSDWIFRPRLISGLAGAIIVLLIIGVLVAV